MSAVKKRQINNRKALKLRDSVRRSIIGNLLESLFIVFDSYSVVCLWVGWSSETTF